jgi:hypothetical protein
MQPVDLPPPRPGHAYVWYFPTSHKTNYCTFVEPLDDLILSIREKSKSKRRYTLNHKESKIVEKIKVLRSRLIKYYDIDEWIEQDVTNP